MATVLGKKVGIGKGRQNDNEEGKPKKIQVTKKAKAQDISLSWSKGSENKKEAYPRRNGSKK